jgi:hypothetical protein
MGPEDSHAPMLPTQRLLPRLDEMVRRGRITEDEAQRVRSAATEDERASALDDIRRRHVRERVAAELADGNLSQIDATSLLDVVDRCGPPRTPATHAGTRSRILMRSGPGLRYRAPAAV